MEEKAESYRDLDLAQTMPNFELVLAIFIYYNVFQFQLGSLIIFFSFRVNRHTQTHTHTNRQTHTQGSENSVFKPQL